MTSSQLTTTRRALLSLPHEIRDALMREAGVSIVDFQYIKNPQEQAWEYVSEGVWERIGAALKRTKISVN